MNRVGRPGWTTNKKGARPVRRKSVKDLGAPEAQSVKGGLAARQLTRTAAPPG